jgi:hypothetical protein
MKKIAIVFLLIALCGVSVSARDRDGCRHNCHPHPTHTPLPSLTPTPTPEATPEPQIEPVGRSNHIVDVVFTYSGPSTEFVFEGSNVQSADELHFQRWSSVYSFEVLPVKNWVFLLSGDCVPGVLNAEDVQKTGRVECNVKAVLK